jgi:hypothetical protein
MNLTPTTWRRRLGLLLLTFSLAACASHPLGEDWERLDAPERTARALEVLEGLFAGGVDGTGSGFTDRRVLSVDPGEIRYVAEDDPHARPSLLAWSAIKSVDSQPLTTFPSRPETLYVHLQEARSGQVRDKVTPALAHAGLASPYLLLPSRPRWSRSRMILALQHLRSSTAPVRSSSPAPVATRTTPRPAPTSLDQVEEKLERLKEWRERGLISEEDYEAKRRALLEGL